MSFLTTITRSSIRTAAATRGPSFLAAYHTSPRLLAPEAAKQPAGEQSQQKLRHKMDVHHEWSEDLASMSESMVKADRGEVKGAEEVEMEEKMYRSKKRQGTADKKPEANPR